MPDAADLEGHAQPEAPEIKHGSHPGVRSTPLVGRAHHAGQRFHPMAQIGFVWIGHLAGAGHGGTVPTIGKHRSIGRPVCNRHLLRGSSGCCHNAPRTYGRFPKPEAARLVRGSLRNAGWNERPRPGFHRSCPGTSSTVIRGTSRCPDRKPA